MFIYLIISSLYGLAKLIMQALGSGSNGNCFAINTKAGTLLIDAGISRARILKGLKELNIESSSLLAVLITHAHSDHIQGLPVLSSYANFRVIATPETIKEIRKKSNRDHRYEIIADQAIGIRYGNSIKYGDYTITIVPAFHDIAGSCGFEIKYSDKTICYTTDTSKVSEPFQEMMRDADYLVIEANHDKAMLENSRRPTWLKRRIRQTHLSNDETMKILQSVVSDKTKMVALAHLSGACNSPEEVIRQVHKYHLDCDTNWDWVVCTRTEKSSIISEIRQRLQLHGGYSSHSLTELDLNLKRPNSNLDAFLYDY